MKMAPVMGIFGQLAEGVDYCMAELVVGERLVVEIVNGRRSCLEQAIWDLGEGVGRRG
jgi:hypothetical protein